MTCRTPGLFEFYKYCLIGWMKWTDVGRSRFEFHVHHFVRKLEAEHTLVAGRSRPTWRTHSDRETEFILSQRNDTKTGLVRCFTRHSGKASNVSVLLNFLQKKIYAKRVSHWVRLMCWHNILPNELFIDRSHRQLVFGLITEWTGHRSSVVKLQMHREWRKIESWESDGPQPSCTATWKKPLL